MPTAQVDLLVLIAVVSASMAVPSVVIYLLLAIRLESLVEDRRPPSLEARDEEQPAPPRPRPDPVEGQPIEGRSGDAPVGTLVLSADPSDEEGVVVGVATPPGRAEVTNRMLAMIEEGRVEWRPVPAERAADDDGD